MPRISRWNHTPAFKSEVASVAITGLLKSTAPASAWTEKGPGDSIFFSAAANFDCLNNRLGSAYGISFSRPSKRGHRSLRICMRKTERCS